MDKTVAVPWLHGCCRLLFVFGSGIAWASALHMVPGFSETLGPWPPGCSGHVFGTFSEVEVGRPKCAFCLGKRKKKKTCQKREKNVPETCQKRGPRF